MNDAIILSDDDTHMVDEESLPICGILRMLPMSVIRQSSNHTDVTIPVYTTSNVFRVTCPKCLTIIKERLTPKQ